MTDQIRKQIFLKASRERVWRAIGDAAEFGKWFGIRFDAPFVQGGRLTGRIVPTIADPEVARLQKPHEGKKCDITIERIQPLHVLSFRWHPYDIDPNVDHSTEPTTLVEFVLEDKPGGTLLTITESGFESIPIERRAQAFKANAGGWEHQTKLIQKYLQMMAA